MIDLQPLMPHLPAWLLVMFRLTGIFLYAPLFGSAAIPARVKAFLAAGLSFCVYPMLLGPGSGAAEHVVTVIENGVPFWALVGMVVSELAIGLVIGFGAMLPILGMQWGGRVIAQQVGFGLAEVFSPDQEQSGLLSELFYLLALSIFISLGGHHVLLRTLVDSFSTVPLGGFAIDGRVMDMVVGLLGSMLDLAVRVAAPLLCLIFLETVTTGFVARTVPQMNILSIGFAVRIMIGSILLIGAVNVYSNVFSEMLYDAWFDLSSFFAPAAT